MIQMRKYLLLFGLGPIILLGCSSNDPIGGTEVSSVPIQLMSTMATRAGQNIQSTEFDKNENINVFLSEATSGTPSTTYAQPMIYHTTDNMGTMAPSNSIFPYYPASGNNVNLWACYPSSVNQHTEFFTVMTDQTEKNSYKASDLMFSRHDGISRQSTVFPITFRHKMAKIQISLTVPDDKDATILDNSRVSITNVMRTIAVTPSEQTLGATSNKGKVLATNNGALNCAAIIVPQTVEPNTYFIEIKLSNGDILNYLLPQSIEFASGTVNSFQITVNEQLLRATYTVSPWVDAPDITGAVSIDL